MCLTFIYKSVEADNLVTEVPHITNVKTSWNRLLFITSELFSIIFLTLSASEHLPTPTINYIKADKYVITTTEILSSWKIIELGKPQMCKKNFVLNMQDINFDYLTNSA